MSNQQIYIFEGPDGCGKTEIARAFCDRRYLKYFKVSTEKENWKTDAFQNSLVFDLLLPQFVRATGQSFVSDRGYPSEWVYSQVFGRETDMNMLKTIDEQFATLGTTIVLFKRRDYSKNRADELVPNERLMDLDIMYDIFARWTKCNVVTMYVDDFGNDIGQQLPQLIAAAEMLFTTRTRGKITLTLGA